MTKLWSDDNGHIACENHMGMYAKHEMAAHPRAKTLRTPLGTWEVLTIADNDEWVREFGRSMKCESCDSTMDGDGKVEISA